MVITTSSLQQLGFHAVCEDVLGAGEVAHCLRASYRAWPCCSAWVNEHGKEAGTFGICAVLCKLSNTGHLCY